MENRIFSIGEIKLLARQSLEGKWKKIIPIFLIYIVFAVAIPAVLSECFDPFANGAPVYAIGIKGGISLYSLLVSGAFSVGAAALALNIIRRKPLSAGTIFDGFKCWPTSFCTLLLIAIYSFFWLLLSQLPSVILFTAAIFTGDSTGISLDTINTNNFVTRFSTFFSNSEAVSFYLIIAGFAASIVLFIAVLIFLLRYNMSFFVVADRSGKVKARDALKASRKIVKGHIFKLFGLSLSFIGWVLLIGLAFSAISVLYYLFAFSALSGGFLTAILVSMMILALGTLIGYTALLAYIQTSYAVFYSIYSGNVRITSQSAGDTEAENSSQFNEEESLVPVTAPDEETEKSADFGMLPSEETSEEVPESVSETIPEEVPRDDSGESEPSEVLDSSGYTDDDTDEKSAALLKLREMIFSTPAEHTDDADAPSEDTAAEEYVAPESNDTDEKSAALLKLREMIFGTPAEHTDDADAPSEDTAAAEYVAPLSNDIEEKTAVILKLRDTIFNSTSAHSDDANEVSEYDEKAAALEALRNKILKQ